VIAIDTNILVYAHRRDSAFHDVAARAVRSAAEGAARWAIPWPCVHEFFAIATHPRLYSPPSSTESAIDQVDAWLESPTLVLLGETDDHWSVLKHRLVAARVAGPMVHDARIAALCIAHGISELWTADRDFGRFAGLATRNPLVEAAS
jgi:toxin-antitoxin system PIN domain toxin